MLKNTIRFELIVDIDTRDIEAYCQDAEVTEDEALKAINNTMYLGLSCIDGMLARQFGITNTDSYVHSVTDGNDNEVI